MREGIIDLKIDFMIGGLNLKVRSLTAVKTKKKEKISLIVSKKSLVETKKNFIKDSEIKKKDFQAEKSSEINFHLLHHGFVHQDVQL